MSGLGGLNKSPNGVVIGVVQLQLPVVATPPDLEAQTERIVAMVAKARRNMAMMDLVVFPEYSLHGLSMDMNPAIMCSLDGPENSAFKAACRQNRIWGCFSLMELNPLGNPYNSGVIIDDKGDLKLYYRKMHPWTPVEPWEPGDIGVPVCEGPKGSRIALIICHDGMFPEVARECAYEGAEIMIRTAGYTAPIRDSWRFTNQANKFPETHGDCERLHVRLRRDFRFRGPGHDRRFRRRDHRGRLDRAARRDHHRRGTAGPHSRGAQALGGREQHLPAWPSRHDRGGGRSRRLPLHLHAGPGGGRCRLPWEEEVVHKDGTAYGFPKPTRRYGQQQQKAAE